jgi:hypothetical protein
MELCDGVTPASITCSECNGTAWSQLYPERFEIRKEATLFWFKPSIDGIKKQTEWELKYFGIRKDELTIEEAIPLQQEHVDAGGLLLAPSKKLAKEWSK